MSDIDRGIRVSTQGHIGVIELARGPHNFFDDEMIAAIAEACESFEATAAVRAIVLCAEGPDGHPKLLHLWPVNLLQAERCRL